MLAEEKSRAVFDQIKALYEQKKSALPGFNEAQTEDEFIKPILDLLGFSFIVQTPAKGMTGRLTPDYALFPDDAAKDKGYEEVQQGNYTNVLAVADAKYWDRPLDKQLKDSRDRFTNQNPTFQISSYLIVTKSKWAILTNGKIWRLYSRDLSRTIGEYYQVDLAEILESGDLNNWLYFYLFFRKEAFQPVPEESFLDQVVRESVDYGAELRENLKSQIFEKIFIFLARGFAAWRRENGTTVETSETLKEIYNNTLILLYRLLFILYAESLDLLPVKETAGYYTKSISKLRAAIKGDIETGKVLSRRSTDYWDDLANLFRIIDRGDPDLNVPKYNGGLFSEDHRFLIENKMSDYHLAEAMYPLTAYSGEATNWNDVFIDYGMLGVKQLGSVYEGLLEFHLNIADQALAVVKEKGKEKYVPVGAVAKGQRDTGVRVNPGDLYLENTKAERKATGSYYTPDYIVEYIVSNTAGPLVDELEAAFETKIDEFKHDPKYRGQDARWKTVHLKEHDPALKALELKICDPAMGSGHFLVTTVDYISQRIYDILAKNSERLIFGKEPYESPLFKQIQEIRANILEEMDRQQVTIDKAKLEDDKVIIRRMVMKRCIFGVDLNYLAVELAKLSLWLNSFTVGAPLSFLDHHLRWGNSLIGATVEAAKAEMETSLFGSRFTGLISAADAMIKVGELTDSTFAELQESQKDYSDAVGMLAPYMDVLDVWTSQFFGNHGAKDLIDHGKLDPDDLETSVNRLGISERQVLNQAKLLKQTKRFFHWELEFPEVFYGPPGKRENGGFDAVIGNPPYVGFHGFEAQKNYLRTAYSTCKGKFDLYIPFWELALRVAGTRRAVSYICPSGFAKREHGANLRMLITSRTNVRRVHDFEHLQVFEGAVNYTCIPLLIKKDHASDEVTQKTLITFGQYPDNPTAEISVDYKKSSDEPWEYSKDMRVLQKAQTMPTAWLKDLSSRIAEGIVTGKNDVFLLNRDNSAYDGLIGQDYVVPALRGECVDRYRFEWDGTYLIYPYISKADRTIPVDEATLRKQSPKVYAYLLSKKGELEGRDYFDRSSKCWYELWNQRSIVHHKGRKLVIQENSVVNELQFDEGSFFYLDTCCGIDFVPGALYHHYYFLTVMNSRMLDYIFKRLTVPKAGGHFIHKPMYLAKLPIRLIAFVTQQANRKEIFFDAKAFYADYLQSADWSPILLFIAELLKKKHQPDPALVKKHNLVPLNKDSQIPESALWEQSDVIHDFLAFLAEQMIAMNKTKQDETSGFLKYVERLIGADIDTLANKTLLKDYHQHSVEEVLAVFERNKNKLKAFNPKSRSHQENLEKEFRASVATVAPLKAKIQATDNLIDQIVYKLYGLSAEEIKIVEESIGG